MDYVERLLAHTEFMRALARSLVDDASRADDVVQDTIVAALKHRPRQPDRMRSWLGRIVRNFAFRSHRSDQRRGKHERATPPRGPVPSTAEILARENARRRVVAAVLRLEEPYRSAVVLRYLEELPPREVARRLGVPVETVRTRVKRALQQLRASLDADHDGDRSAWSLALVPFLVPAPATAGALAGVALMSTKVKLGLVAALVLLGGAVAVWNPFDRSTGETPGARSERRASAQATRVKATAAAVPKADADAEEARDAPEAGAGRIMGRVLADGKPVAGAYVALHTEDDRVESLFGTDATGSFAFERVGTFTLRAAHADRRPARKEITAPPGQVTDVEIELAPAPYLVIRVIDAVTGAPVPDAEVLLVRTTGSERGQNVAIETAFVESFADEEGWYGMARRFSAFDDTMGVIALMQEKGTTLHVPPKRTGRDGSVRLGGLLPGPFELIVSHAAYPSTLAHGESGEKERTLDVRLGHGASFTVIAPRYKGYVCEIDKAALMPLPVAKAQIDERGRAVFNRLRPGEYVLAISPKGAWQITMGKATEEGPDGKPVEKRSMSVSRATGSIVLKRSVTLKADENVLDLSDLKGATIRGRVAGATGAWLVTLYEGKQERASTATEATGEFVFRDVAPGAYRVSATRQGGGTEVDADLEIGPGDEEVEVTVRAARGLVTGLVTGSDDRPLNGAALFAVARDARAIQEPGSLDELMGFLIGHTETDQEGRFRIEHVPAGEFVLFCGHKGFLARHEFRLETDQTRRVDFRLSASHLHRVMIRLTDGAGDATTGHVVVRGALGGTLTAFVLDPDVFSPERGTTGEYVYHLAGGEYFLDVYAEGMAPIRGRVLTVNGNEHETIRLTPGVPLHLTLEGAPETRVEVRTAEGLRISRGITPLDVLFANSAWRTDAKGRLVLPHVAPGEYTISIDGKEIGTVRVGKTEVRQRFRVR